MKNLKTAFNLVAAFLVSCLVLSCQKESFAPLETEMEVSFSINSPNLKSTNKLKSIEDYNLSEADKIILTIQEADGSPTKYTSSEVKVQQMNGIYYTQKIVLKTGEYQLTEFALKNDLDSTIFITPVVGSPEAQNVTNSLPIQFSAGINSSSYIDVEVLSTEKKTPEDFGYNRFPIAEVKTFGFLIGVSDSKSDELLSAKLTVSSSSYVYSVILDAISNNVVSVKDDLGDYTIKLEKSGYSSYVHNYPMDSLKMYMNEAGNLPLMIELVKAETVTDYDGNVYETVVVGDQIWMAENLKVTHYRNGDEIPNITSGSAWPTLSSGAYCWYSNDSATYKNNYGALYNWYAVADNRNIAPLGWHVPTQAELITLIEYLGTESIAGGKMKEAGFAHWDSPNTGADNNSGLYCLAAGDRTANFESLGVYATFWSSTTRVIPWAIGIQLNNTSPSIMWAEFNKWFGFSVRCVKD